MGVGKPALGTDVLAGAGAAGRASGSGAGLGLVAVTPTRPEAGRVVEAEGGRGRLAGTVPPRGARVTPGVSRPAPADGRLDRTPATAIVAAGWRSAWPAEVMAIAVAVDVVATAATATAKARCRTITCVLHPRSPLPEVLRRLGGRLLPVSGAGGRRAGDAGGRRAGDAGVAGDQPPPREVGTGGQSHPGGDGGTAGRLRPVVGQ
ncbi:MAG TPA: hypothetical protein VKU91_06270, partial [Acidimicrobiales bacterium]|nr:hypothetical protein [Acidimicrobiales bacterium]